MEPSRLRLPLLLLALCVPPSGAIRAADAPDDLPSRIATLEKRVQQQAAEIERLKRAVARMAEPSDTSTPAQPEPTPAPEPPGRTHTVSKGETLTAIAKSHGTTIDEIKSLNDIRDERRLQIGQVLKLPPLPEPAPQAGADGSRTE